MRPTGPIATGRPTDTDESTDTWDTIDWLVKHVPCNNGRVGMWGISYPGFYVSAGMIDAHPALKAVSPQAPVTDYYLGDDAVGDHGAGGEIERGQAEGQRSGGAEGQRPRATKS